MSDSQKMTDIELMQSAKAGNRKSLNDLVEKYQTWIFNIALSFVADKDDAADITQEVLIKIVTHLSTFRMESDFKTWVFRIVKNHFLNMNRRKYEVTTTSFQAFGEGLDNIPDEEIEVAQFKVEQERLIEEAKISCLRGMLLCLNREQRLIYILGDIFGVPDSLGSEVMEVSKSNFRVKLHRARTELYNFMNGKCGLINKSNPCRCAKKTVGFIKMGCVDPVKLNFQTKTITNVQLTEKKRLDTVDKILDPQYQKIFKEMPHLEIHEKVEMLNDFISSKAFLKAFDTLSGTSGVKDQ